MDNAPVLPEAAVGALVAVVKKELPDTIAPIIAPETLVAKPETSDKLLFCTKLQVEQIQAVLDSIQKGVAEGPLPKVAAAMAAHQLNLIVLGTCIDPAVMPVATGISDA